MPDYRAQNFLRSATRLAARIDLMRSQSDSGIEILQVMPEIANLINDVRNWQPRPCSATAPYMASEENFNALWRQGLLCFIYHDVCLLPSQDHRIQACVSSALPAFQDLFWLQACLWPVLMIAVHVMTVEARACFISVLRKMNSSLRFMLPLSLVAVLETIWHELDNDTTGQQRWKNVIRNSGLELIILL
ncbi:hypothetical protein BJX96DRAFT_170970 [Aspergillus floccosus]